MVKRLAGYRFYADLLKAIKRQIRELQGPEDAEIRAYYRGYASFLERCQPEASTQEAFLDRTVEVGLALVGDFHTLDQAQNQYVKVVRALCERGGSPVLALEMVHARHNPALQRYMEAQEPDDGEFLEEIGFFDHWGFDFAHYSPILSLARKNGLPVRGINGEGSLLQRDRSMAERLLAIRAEFPNRPVLVLVGDLHLAPGHLPKELMRRGASSVLLYQNSETVIMGGLRRNADPYGWFEVGVDRFLVNNTPPWVKMETYRTWLEHGGEALSVLRALGPATGKKGREEEDEDEESGPPDLTEMVHGYIHVLKDLFDLHLRPDDTFQAYSMNDLDFLDDPYFRRQPGRTYAGIIREGRALYLRRGNLLYIPLLDVNRTVQEAAHFLMQTDLEIAHTPRAFFKRLHYFASGYLASKVINPLRHNHSREAMRKAKQEWARARSPKERRYAQRQVAVFKATVDFFGLIEHYGGCTLIPLAELRRFLEADEATRFAVSEQIGFQLGEGLYESYAEGALSGTELKHYIFSQSDPFHYCLSLRRQLAAAVNGSSEGT